LVNALHFTFYGITLQVCCDDPEVATRVAGDFSYFRTERETAVWSGDVEIKAYRRAPSYENLPALPATVHTARNISYSDGDITYIDYFGRALAIYDRRASSLSVESEHPHLLHEIVFLTILSRVGAKLEAKGMHRVHALAVVRGGDAALFAMPSGSGKTSLAMEFLRHGGSFQIAAEDSPLVDRSGRLLPFPLRFGVKEKPENIAEHHITRIQRMEFEPKYLISLDAFTDAIATSPARPTYLFFGRRTLGTGCTIEAIGRLRGLRGLVRDMVVGVGLYQGIEFLLQSSVVDLWRSGRLFASRLLRALQLLRNCELYRVDLGRRREQNAAEIIRFLDERGFGSSRKRS
jgi:hypothetical protein